MEAMDAFTLSLCVPSDAPELARVHYDIFSKPPMYRAIYAGIEPAKIIDKYEKGFKDGIEGQHISSATREAKYWKVTDNTSGVIAGYTVWVFLPRGYDPSEDPQTGRGEIIPGENEPLACEFASVTSAARRQHEGRKGPHYLLAVLGTHPKYERRGVATMLVRSIFDRADKEGLPCYVDSSKTGHTVYERCGFKDVSSMSVDLDKYDKSGFGVQTWFGMVRTPLKSQE